MLENDVLVAGVTPEVAIEEGAVAKETVVEAAPAVAPEAAADAAAEGDK